MSILFILLMLPEAPFVDEASAAPADPDLMVADIWTTKGTEIDCRIENIGGAFSGPFGVNVTIDGKYMETKIVALVAPSTILNVTFSTLLPGGWSKVEVRVDIYDPQHGIPDQNRSNDARTERWERDLPDLAPVSVFNDPATGTARIMVENAGAVPTSYGFDTSLYVNGSEVETVHWKPPIPPDASLTLNTTWKWDRAVSPVDLKVIVDAGDDVEEIDESDNALAVKWQNRPRPAFTKPPTVQYTGKDNATIVWETSVPTDFVVEYGRSSKLAQTTMTKAITKKGSAEISGLSPSTQYLYKVVCTDQYGRRVESKVGSLLTKEPTPNGAPSGSFVSELLGNVSGKMTIPFNGADPTGIEKVDFYLGGRLIGSRGGSGKGESSGIPFDFSKVKAGNYELVAVITNIAGGTSRFETTCSVGSGILGWYPRVTFNVGDRTMRGTEGFYARCEDPSGIANVTWLIDGSIVEFEVPWHPEASYHGATIWWDSSTVADGEHTIEVKVFNNEGNLTTRSRMITVDNILDPPDPDIWVRRLNIEREGTVLTVPLEVSNHGRGTARNIRIVDNIKGFVPIDGEEGTRAVFGEGTRWEVVQEIDHLDPDDVVQIRYRCIPLLYHSDEWCIGYELPDPDHPGIDYTTAYSYDRDDGMVSYSKRTWIPTANFEEGYIMRAGALHTISLSNYVLLTNPQRLLSNMAFGDGYFDLFSQVGPLLEKKNGVFGFIRNVGGSSPSAPTIVNTIDGWADHLHPDFREEGYLAILGEDEIIPAHDYAGPSGSDQIYSNLDGGTEPRLIVGRFLGRTPEELLTPVRASLEVARMNKLSDPTEDVLLISGSGNGVLDFHDNMVDLYDSINPMVDSLLFYHKSQFLPSSTSSLPSDGKSRHMVGGDVDLDGDNEIVTLDPAADRVRVLHPETGTFTQFTVPSEENDLVVIFTDPTGTYIGHFYEGDTCGEMALYTLSGVKDFTYNNIEGWQYGDGVLIFDEDLDGFDDIFIASAGSDTISHHSCPESYPVADIHPDSRMARADMDDDGDLDLVMADHQDDKLRVFFWPPPASGTWEEESITVSGLDYEDGFGAGNYIPSGRDNRGEAVVLRHDSNGYFQICWLKLGDTGTWWEGLSEQTYLTDVRDDCALTVASSAAGPENDEVLVSTSSDRAFVFDHSDCGRGFRDTLYPLMVGKDLMVFRDHGNWGEWSGLVGSDGLDGIGIGSMRHIPVMIGLVCESGRFHDTVDSFAQSAMRNGAGVYIGATVVSDRYWNDRSIPFIEDYVGGTPIGRALRDYEVDCSAADPNGGLEWARMYNLYGDPAFGTDGSPPGSRSRGTPPRSGQVEVALPDPVLFNVSGGTGVSIEGGFELCEIGRAVLPYVIQRIPLGFGTGVASVDVEMTGEWSYYPDLSMPLYTGPEYDGAGIAPRTFTEGDPDDGFYPVRTSDWNVVAGTEGNDLMVRIYPFEYDMLSSQGRFCPAWSIAYETEICPVGIVRVIAGEPEVGIVPFSFELDGSSDIEVSFASWIEFGGEVVEELSSGTILVNATTSIDDVWDTEGSGPGTYEYVVELRTDGGSVLSMYSLPFEVGALDLPPPVIELKPSIFVKGDVVNVTILFPKLDVPKTLEGRYEYALLTNDSTVISESNSTINIYPLGYMEGNVSMKTWIDTSILTGDRYAVMCKLIVEGYQASSIAWLIRNGTMPEPPVHHGLLIDFALNATQITEGGSFWINGTVLRDDELAIPGLPVAGWIGERERSNSTLTSSEGSFSLKLEDVPVGNWTGGVLAGLGDVFDSSSFFIRVLSLPSNDTNGNNTNGNNTNGNNTNGNNTNGNNTNGNNTNGTGNGGGGHRDGWFADHPIAVLIAGTAILVAIVLIVVMVFLLVLRRKDKGIWGPEE